MHYYDCQLRRKAAGKPLRGGAAFELDADHLNTPRAVYDDQQQLRWKWEMDEPFGVNAANEDPSSLGIITFPLRFPGQYADKETNLHYNYYRSYDPGLGRYKRSDPVGLRGGLNTYTYVANSPLYYSDPFGLWMPWTHKMMTEEALEGFGCRNLDGLPLATADVDGVTHAEQRTSQSAENAFWHNMRTKGTSQAEGQENVAQYLNTKRASCDVKDLARVLHVVQDGISPAHEGVQEWGGDESIAQLISHGIQEFFPSPSRWSRSVSKSAEEIAAFIARCPCTCK